MILVSGRFSLAILFRRVARLNAECVRHFHDACGLPRFRLTARLNLTLEKTRILSGAFAPDAKALKR
jgi:hypothetical protein